MTRRTILALVIGLVLGSGLTLGFALLRGGLLTVERPTETQALAPQTVPVTRQLLVDSSVISGEVAWANTSQPIALDGIVTQMPVADGGELAPGDVLIAVDDRPVAALEMAFGLWRPLAPGDKGADVRAIHAALAKLGTFDGPVGAPFSAKTLDALGEIDPRLGDEPLRPESVVPVAAAGATLDAAGVRVGTRLGELTVGVSQPGDRIVVDDGGMAERYVQAGQTIDLFDAGGKTIWTGVVDKVEVDSAQSLVTVHGDEDTPAEFSGASVILAESPSEVLAVPRVALIPQPDGTSAVTVVDATGTATEHTVTTGMCAADLCEIQPQDPAFPGEGALVAVR